MKALILALSLVATTSAFAAEKVVLECSTNGDALDYVRLVDNQNGSASLKVGYVSDEVKTYTLSASLKNIKAGDSDTLVAAKDFNDKFGGAIWNAVLMRVLPGQKSAFLALGGAVYTLHCYKP